jgi:hypothetical protein
MIFVIFDIEVVFLYPFAVMYRQLGLFGFVEIASFTVVVFIAFAYLVSEGALDWGPGKRFGTRSGAPVTRSLSASVRRVSRPGAPPSRAYTGAGTTTGTGSGTGTGAGTTSAPAVAVPAGEAAQ